MDRWDFLAAAGIALIGGGLWMLAPWLGVTVSGVLVLAVGIAGGVVAEASERQAAQAAAAPGTGDRQWA